MKGMHGIKSRAESGALARFWRREGLETRRRVEGPSHLQNAPGLDRVPPLGGAARAPWACDHMDLMAFISFIMFIPAKTVC